MIEPGCKVRLSIDYYKLNKTMIKSYQNYKLGYIFLFIGLLASTYLINTSNKLTICSIFFSMTLLASNVLVQLYGREAAIKSYITCILCNIALYGSSLNLMLAVSFIAILTSQLVCMQIFLYLKSSKNFLIASLLSALIALLVDEFIMALGIYSYIFTGNKILYIVSKSFLQKAVYLVIFVKSYCKIFGMERKIN